MRSEIYFDVVCGPENWYAVFVYESEMDKYPLMRFFADYNDASGFARMSASVVAVDCGRQVKQ